MRVLISHAYSTENKGDAALLDVLIQDIRRQYGHKCKIDILTIDSVEPGSTFNKVQLHEAFMYYAFNRPHTKIGKLLYSIWMMIYTLLWASLKRRAGIGLPLPAHWRKTVNLYERADLIITVGGGYFRSSADKTTFISLLLMLHPLKFAQILGKPTCLYTMSVGPFSRSIEKTLVARMFRKLPLILIREDTSLKLLKTIGVEDNVKRSIDSGFLFTSSQNVKLRQSIGLRKSDVLVGVTARKWFTGRGQEAYEQEFAKALDEIIRLYKVDIVFIPQVTSTINNDDDRVISRHIAKRMKNAKNVHIMDGNYDHYQVKAMYDELDYIIGTRFHSVIFSLTSYVPAIAIEYEHKTSGIMRDLELSQWIVKIEDVKAKILISQFTKLHTANKDYVSGLKKILPEYVNEAKSAIKEVDKAYKSYIS